MGYFQFLEEKKIFCFALLYSLWQVKLNFCQSFPLIEYTNHLGRPIVYELMIQSHQPICSFLSATSIPRDLSWGPLLTTSCSENCRLWSSHFIYGNTESQSKKFQQNNFFFLNERYVQNRTLGGRQDWKAPVFVVYSESYFPLFLRRG